jgi:vacuolar-type H+-ATPase subunit I/STV1
VSKESAVAKVSPHELKSLSTQKTQIVAQLKHLQVEQVQLKSRLTDLNTQLSSINQKIKQVKSVPVVTEHALLRYIERVLRVNLQEIQERILTKELVGHMQSNGSGDFVIAPGVWAVIQDRVVVSIETKTSD